MKFLLASDLSDRSHHALWRACLLASQFDAQLTVLHIVDKDLPNALQDMTVAGAREFLQNQLSSLKADLTRTQLVVEAGDSYRAIIEHADEQQADLIIMGAHRRQVIKDVFTGTTIERVMRAGKRPVLMVNTKATVSYTKIAAALDLSDTSEQVLRGVMRLGLLQEDVSVIHAYTPIAKTLMRYADVEEELVDRHLIASHEEALTKLQELFEQAEYSHLKAKWFVEEGEAFDVIRAFTRKVNPDLLVLGTRGYHGIKRLLLGSVADHLLREIDTDMLVVPI